MLRSLLSALVVLATVFAFTGTAAAARLVAHIDISNQTMTVWKNGRAVANWPVSTARSGYYTPRGTYGVKRMHTMWHSRKYDMSPMPHSIFFHKGWAIHGTGAIRSLGRPASHGCVRLHPANARQLYSWTQQVGAGNMRVRITN